MLGREKLVIWGASRHAEVVVDIVQLLSAFHLVGFLDDVHPGRQGCAFGGATILGGQEQFAELRSQGVSRMFLAFGDCQARWRLSEVARSAGFSFPALIHPQAVVARSVSVGAGTLIAAGSVVNPATTVGEQVIINTAASVDHHCVLEDACHLAPGVHLAGGVTVGRAAFLGIGAVVTENVTVGARAVVGAGSLVRRDIPPGVVAFGVPARVIRDCTP